MNKPNELLSSNTVSESSSLTTGIRIELPFIDIPDVRRDSLRKECYIILCEKYLEYKVISKYTDLDDGITTYRKSNYRWVRKRSSISDVDMSYDSVKSIYSVGLDFDGVGGNGIQWTYSTGKEAKELYDQLYNYFTTQPF